MSSHHENARKRHHQAMVEEHWREEQHCERRCNFIIVAVMFALFAVCFTWHQVRIWSDQEIANASVPQKTVTLVMQGGKFGPTSYDPAFWHRDGHGNLVDGNFSVPENAQNILGDPAPSPMTETNLSLRKAMVNNFLGDTSALKKLTQPMAATVSEGTARKRVRTVNAQPAGGDAKARLNSQHLFIGHYQNGVVTTLFIRGGHIVPKSEFMDSADVDGAGYPEYAK